ncbi:MAG: hypothetical protein IJI46_05720 [Erysipelotrichaceae bacterium]|nr:hypothetical protein [Erysipelotrichaceae bacterium]
MKRFIIIAMLLSFILSGCSKDKTASVKKEEKQETKEEIKQETVIVEETDDDLSFFYGAWRTDGVVYNGAEFTMDQVKAIDDPEQFDAIFVINEDGNIHIGSFAYRQAETQAWQEGDEPDCIITQGAELYKKDDRLLVNIGEDGGLLMQKISDRQDIDIIYEIMDMELESEKETVKEETVEEEPAIAETADDVIRPEIKEAIDAYEDFVDEYIAFMKKYEESDGSDFSILLDYVTFMDKLQDYTDKMEALEADMTDAEYWYYIDVLNRCNEKMIKALD